MRARAHEPTKASRNKKKNEEIERSSSSSSSSSYLLFCLNLFVGSLNVEELVLFSFVRELSGSGLNRCCCCCCWICVIAAVSCRYWHSGFRHFSFLLNKKTTTTTTRKGRKRNETNHVRGRCDAVRWDGMRVNGLLMRRHGGHCTAIQGSNRW